MSARVRGALPGAARASSASHPLVGEARGVGLIGALELVADKATKTVVRCRARHGRRLTAATRARQARPHHPRRCGDTLAFCPPLIIEDKEIDQLFDRLAATLDQTLAELKRRGVK